MIFYSFNGNNKKLTISDEKIQEVIYLQNCEAIIVQCKIIQVGTSHDTASC